MRGRSPLTLPTLLRPWMHSTLELKDVATGGLRGNCFLTKKKKYFAPLLPLKKNNFT